MEEEKKQAAQEEAPEANRQAQEHEDAAGQQQEEQEQQEQTKAQEGSQDRNMNNKHLWVAITMLTVAIALSLWLGISFYNNIDAAKAHPDVYDAGNYVVVFFLLAVFTFLSYIITTMQLRLYKNRPRWLGWLGVLGPVGVIILALVKIKQPEPEPEPLPEPEPDPGPVEETLEAQTIQVRTSDGRIINLKTVSEIPEELQKGEGQLVEGQEAGEETAGAEEEGQGESRDYNLQDGNEGETGKDENPPNDQGGNKKK